MYGTATPGARRPVTGTDLGLYSITFNNDLDADYASLQAFTEFRAEAAACGFKYFLEVFNPNVDTGIDSRAAAPLHQRLHRPLPGRRRQGRPAAVPQDRL